MYIYAYLYVSLSLSLYIYIYTYTYNYIDDEWKAALGEPMGQQILTKIDLSLRLLRSAFVSGIVSLTDAECLKGGNYCCNLLLLNSSAWDDHHNQLHLFGLNTSVIMYTSTTRTFHRLVLHSLNYLAVLMNHFMCSEMMLFAVYSSKMNDYVGSYCDRVYFHYILVCHRWKRWLYFCPECRSSSACCSDTSSCPRPEWENRHN